MEKSQKIVQIYGYTICLVAIITFIIAITSLVNSIIDRGDPLHTGWTPAGTPSLASYENYKMDILKSNQKEGDISKNSYQPDDNTLRGMYEAAKADKIQSSTHQANKNIIVDSILIILSFIIFITHWLWMRKILRKEN